MAFKTVGQLKDSVAGILSGININNISDLNGALERAVSNMLQKADVPEASGIQNITLYSGVFDYLCDEKIFGTAINDIRPQGISRNPADFVTKTDQETFDRNKNYSRPSLQTMSTFQYQNGEPIIRITAPFPKQQIIIDPMNSTTGWTASGSASGLTADYTDFYQSPASLRFTLTGSSTGILTKDPLDEALSMASYEDVGVAFLAIEIPTGSTASNLTGITLRLGSDSSNYDTVSETEGFLGAWVSGQWLLVAFDFAGSSSTGTPDWSSIEYCQIRFAHSATFTNFRVGGLWMSLPSPAQILYQSGAIFLPSGSTTPLTTITDNDDEVLLTLPAYNIYVYESALACLENTGASASDATTANINRKLDGNPSTGDIGLYARYRGDNPSQELRTTGSYYSTELPYNGYW